MIQLCSRPVSPHSLYFISRTVAWRQSRTSFLLWRVDPGARRLIHKKAVPLRKSAKASVKPVQNVQAALRKAAPYESPVSKLTSRGVPTLLYQASSQRPVRNLRLLFPRSAASRGPCFFALMINNYTRRADNLSMHACLYLLHSTSSVVMRSVCSLSSSQATIFQPNSTL